ncbi:cadmium transporter [Actinoplanes sp. SE50]|uniref:ArsR/SmtB family transcription factor n=1 Tax=unclassified Actinoplanes TaxID=2626549 RepID=UPI00023EBD62|nr:MULTISPECIES: metalloregulator ArsR/SmtB family transcription factor [unclassified Actinoplanes]AEV85096.1 Cadmium efflux system accessory-like protein [Actinoplanes sp. SE50/110]ATO83487.1 cadmium transporter [Actinoplanes sp. SE50]SLM00894.1 ArsR-family transcriptional regulator [Actinoplanes sp. SE50/110]
MRARDNVADASELQKHLTGDTLTVATTMLGLLADPTRLRLLAALVPTDQDVSALTTTTGAARPAVSQHLAKLRLAGLVRVRREGRRQVYALAGPHIATLITEVLHAAARHR